MITFMVSKNILNIGSGWLLTIISYILLYTDNVKSAASTTYEYVYLFLILIYVMIILYTLYKVLDKEMALFVGIVFLASLMSRFILGLSPSNFTSLTRTSINMYFFQMICIITMLSNTKPLFLENYN